MTPREKRSLASALSSRMIALPTGGRAQRTPARYSVNISPPLRVRTQQPAMVLVVPPTLTQNSNSFINAIKQHVHTPTSSKRSSRMSSKKRTRNTNNNATSKPKTKKK